MTLEELHDDLGRIFSDKGAGSVAFLQKARSWAMADRQGDAKLRARTLLLISRLLFQCGEAKDAVLPARMALSIAQARNDESLTLSALVRLGAVLSAEAVPVEALEHLTQAIEIAQRMRDRPAKIRALASISYALQSLSMLVEACDAAEHAYELANQEPRLVELSVVSGMNLASALFHRRHFARGYRVASEALQSTETQGFDGDARYLQALLLANLVRLSIELRRNQEALDFITRALALVEATELKRARVAVFASHGLFLVRTGKARQGLARINEAIELAQGDRPYLREAELTKARAHRMLGEHDKAAEIRSRVQQADAQIRVKSASLQIRQRISRASDGLIQFQSDDAEVSVRTRAEINAQVEAAQREALERLAALAELRVDPTGRHSYRVGRLARLLGEACGVKGEKLDELESAARLHDIGKLGIPDFILQKPGPLTAAEHGIMKQHTLIGVTLLQDSRGKRLRTASAIARSHHEHWDGSGYPDGLRGGDIPMAARIVAIADAFDSMTRKRSYKEAWPPTKALDEIERSAGTQFDPELVELFAKAIKPWIARPDELETYLSSSETDSELDRARAIVGRSVKI
jgi:response regulator RpfG family c-di-GMP phosphodiesterase